MHEKNDDTKSLVNMFKLDEEVLSPSEYLNLSPEEIKDIRELRPVVRPLGSTSLSDSSFVSFLVKWNHPKYQAVL